MKNIAALILLILLFSCKKDNLEKRESIVGKWRMVEYCFSPGDPSCPIQKIDKNKGQTVDFQNDGKLIVENPFNKIAIFACGGEWKIIDDKKFEAVFSCESPLDKKTVYYLLKPDGQLNIYAMCIEECRYTFEPVN